MPEPVEAQNFVMTNDNPGFTGVFVGKAKIVEARSVSNEDIYKNGRPVDCGIEFKLDIGKDFTPFFTIAGNFKVENGMVKGTGSATRVKIALNRLRVNWDQLNPDNSIPQNVLDQCIGKEIVKLQYPYKKNEETGKNKYATFTDFFLSDVPDAEKLLRQKYNDAVANGYVKPLQDESIDFPPSDNGSVNTLPEKHF